MNGQNDFSDLEHFVLEISSITNFDTITKWMEDRFIGLPLFHKSVHLKVKSYKRVIENETRALQLPTSVYRMTDSHLKKALNELMAHVQRKPGIKNFGLLHLSVKLVPELLQQESGKYRDHGRHLPNWLIQLGGFLEVPVILAVASRKTDNYYESLAVGIRGVGNYSSFLALHSSENNNTYKVHAGLQVGVSLAHINHLFPRLFCATNCNLLPTGFLNRYLQNHLIPEREEIVKKLCAYVFQGCTRENNRSEVLQITQIARRIPILN